MSDAEDTGAETEIETLASDAVVTKYKQASEIVNNALKLVVQVVVPGKTTNDVTTIGDALLKTQIANAYKAKKNVQKGVAFPVCVSVNECVGNYSPLKSDEPVALKEGDVVKISLGVHIDGFVAVGANTIVVRAAPGAPVVGPAADVTLAAYHGAQAALKTMRPGATNQDVTKVVNQVAACYGVNTVSGVLMHQIKRWVIDGNNVVLLREDDEHHAETFEFEAGNVYTVDVVMSTGAGKPTVRDARTTVFKRNPEKKFGLKVQAARALVSQVDKEYSTFPFALRLMPDEKQARLGLKECLDHELFVPYPVTFEKPGDLVAHFQYTVLIMPSGNVSWSTGLPADLAVPGLTSDKALTPELLELVNRVDDKKKKKAAAAAAAPAASDKPAAA